VGSKIAHGKGPFMGFSIFEGIKNPFEAFMSDSSEKVAFTTKKFQGGPFYFDPFHI
jgi:hypothetical protein